MTLLRAIRGAQRRVLQIETSYYFYNEDTRHHFRTWIMPRYEWMAEFGHSVSSVLPALKHARDHMASEDELAAKDAVHQLPDSLASDTSWQATDR